MRFIPMRLAAAVAALGFACTHASPRPSLPPHPDLQRPSGAVPRDAASLAGAWQGVGDDGVPTMMLVPVVEPAGARVLLAREPRPGAPGDAWHTWADVPFGAGGSARLSWDEEGSPIAFALDPRTGRLRGQLRDGGRDVGVALERVEYPPSDRAACPVERELRAIARAASAAERAAAVEALVSRVARSGVPVVEAGSTPSTRCVTWLYRGAAQEVLLAGDMNGWHGAEHPLARAGDSDLWSVSVQVPTAARLDYKLVVDGQSILDPLNGRTMAGGYGPNSELAMPGYMPPRDVERAAAVPRGVLEDLTVRSRHMGDERKAKVYLPPGYERGAERYPVLYVHDGRDPIAFGAMDVVLDNLIARKAIPPVIAVFVAPVHRFPEYVMNAQFEAFFLDEVIPTVDARYRTRPVASARAVAGISLGGLAALSLTLQHPDVFGACIAQSSSIRFAQFDLLRAAAREASPRPRIYLDAGRYDADLHGWNLLAQTRRMRDELVRLGYALRYEEPDEGHSWGSWRARFGEALAFVWGDSSNAAAAGP